MQTPIAVSLQSQPGGNPLAIIKVSAKSRSTSVAGAIAGVMREAGKAEVQAIGAGAVNQAVKAVAIARGYLLQDGIDAVCIPLFAEVSIEDQERTSIKLLVQKR
jgi:stage V sporulation protein S